ncbi:MAG TPA: YicC family protein [Bacteroidales bacterium]|nr:YicC family protein [Bacteroidales bacterium]
MIKSMTGYGKAVAEIPQKKIVIEIKSLNSKQFDLNVRLPWLYREKESEIRNIISRKLDRGKIDLNISFDALESEVVPSINKAVVKNYYNQIKEIADELAIVPDCELLSTILKFPDALKTEKPELPEEEWNLILGKLNESIEQLDNYRSVEGKSLESDLRECIQRITSFLDEIKIHEAERITRIREKLNNLLTENYGKENIDENRFEQELIFYLEKLDFNEEKVRLRNHCDYFIEKISSTPPNGKILSFIAQEIGREINTIGSKANDASIQKLVVMMKDDLEKIKEQTLNVL